MRVSQALEAGTVSLTRQNLTLFQNGVQSYQRPHVLSSSICAFLNLFRRFTFRFTPCDDLSARATKVGKSWSAQDAGSQCHRT